MAIDPLSIHNDLLRQLPAAELMNVLRHAEVVDLVSKQKLLTADRKIEYVYFIESGVVSNVCTLEDGHRAEVGVSGFEGMVGSPIALGTDLSPWDAMVQVPGQAVRLTNADFLKVSAESPTLVSLVLRYIAAMQAQIAQSIACNTRHDISQRLACWLLSALDRVDDDNFAMTHEFLSIMLGVQRPAVTRAVGVFQRAGIIKHARGVMHVLDRVALEATACECYQTVTRRFACLGPGQPRKNDPLCSRTPSS